ncbi:MAG: DUF456 domain-containing protein [Limisphaerales bacterium]
MTTEEMIGLAIALSVMLVGVIGSLIPAIPSATLVLASAVVHKLVYGTASVGVWPMVALVVITAFTLIMDYLATMIGTKKLGGSWWGIFGACIGAIIGMFIPLPILNMFIGTFGGAIAFEMIGGREFKDATRAGLGAMIGLLAGSLGKLAGCIAMIGIFSYSVVSNAMAPAELPNPEPTPIVQPTTQ